MKSYLYLEVKIDVALRGNVRHFYGVGELSNISILCFSLISLQERVFFAGCLDVWTIRNMYLVFTAEGHSLFRTGYLKQISGGYGVF